MVIITRSEMRKIQAIEKIVQQKFIAKQIPTGPEICEIQLYHLANKIKDTKIDKDVENYLPAINDVLQGIDRDELIKKIVSVEFTRFSNYYNKTKDLNSNSSGERGERRRDRDDRDSFKSDGAVRYFINVGEKDGYDWMTLKDFIRDTASLGKEDIFKVDVKDSFSFFNSEAGVTDQILNTFTEFKVEGRFVNVEVSKSPGGGGGGGGRRSGGGGYDKGRKKDKSRDRGGRRDKGFSKSSSSDSGKGRSKRRSDFF